MATWVIILLQYFYCSLFYLLWCSILGSGQTVVWAHRHQPPQNILSFRQTTTEKKPLKQGPIWRDNTKNRTVPCKSNRCNVPSVGRCWMFRPEWLWMWMMKSVDTALASQATQYESYNGETAMCERANNACSLFRLLQSTYTRRTRNWHGKLPFWLAYLLNTRVKPLILLKNSQKKTGCN